MVDKLKAKKVVVMDFQEPYSLGLADMAEKVLKSEGRLASAACRPPNTTDFSSFVTRVPSDADIVFFPTQKPGDAQTFAQQLVEQGKKAKVFGGDGSNNPAQFKVGGLVRLELRPGHHRHRRRTRRSIAGWKKDNPRQRSARSGRRPTARSRSC